MSTMPSADVGARIKSTAVFAVDGTATDPTAVAAETVDPLGTITSLTPIKDTTGNWHASIDLTGAYPGVWYVRWTGSGACQAAEESPFLVEKSAFS